MDAHSRCLYLRTYITYVFVIIVNSGHFIAYQFSAVTILLGRISLLVFYHKDSIKQDMLYHTSKFFVHEQYFNKT